MDNRRVFRSHREKLRSASTPYDRKGGLLSRVKRIITPTWTSSDNDRNDVGKSGNIPEKSSSVKRFNFPETSMRSDTAGDESVANESAAASTLLSDDVNPTQVLSKFFQQKGDTPLTQVEYEGVMSLLLRSKTGGVSADNSVIIGGSTASVGRPSSNSGRKSADKRSVDRANLTTSHIQMPGSFSTSPYAQKSLRNTSMRERSMYVSTPEYKPHYKSINNTVNIPSVKRVYQFSGLPSPYKTKIRPPPSLSANTSMNSTILLRSVVDSSHIDKVPVSASTAANSPAPSSRKPLSETANTLLSILDGKQSSADVVETGLDSERLKRLKLLSNPYGRGSGLKKSRPGNSLKLASSTPAPAPAPAPKKGPAVFTADDITKTIAYDQSEALPEPEPKRPAESAPIVKKAPEVSVPSNKAEPHPAVAIPPVAKVPVVAESEPVVKPIEPFSVISNGSVAAPKTVPEHPKPSIAPSLTQKQSEYVFPQLKSLTVQVDEGKVEQYKSLFNF